MKPIMAAALAFLLSATLATAQAAPPPNGPTDAEVADARALFLAGDHAAALALLIPAADAGHPRAQNIVGSAYQYGTGVAISAPDALRYFEMAAAQGFPPALHNLGVLYETGMTGVATDPARAREYYARAAALDYGPAHGAMVGYLLNGWGGPVDEVNALRAAERGAQMGDPMAVEWIGWFLKSGSAGMEIDPLRAYAHFEIAAFYGRAFSMNAMGEMLETGDGPPRDRKRAMMLYQQAIAGDHARAGINLAWMIWENRDLFSDDVLGLAYCYWAVDASDPVEERPINEAACNEVAVDYSDAEQADARSRAAAM